MTDRYGDYSKGSSRSTRDDSRAYKERDWEGRDGRKTRSRSRSPRRRSPSSSTIRYSAEKSLSRSTTSRDREYDDKRRNCSPKRKYSSDEEEDVPEPPPPPRISKIKIGFSKPSAPIKMSLNTSKPVAPKPTVASVFNTDDDDEEPEEMPAEAKMRMRNIGRETPTSAGPNSFGKTKQGFCDSKKVFEKNLKEALDSQTAEKAQLSKFPQTIYRIKGP